MTQVSLPFSGATTHSRHASYTGAVVAERTRGVKTQLYLQWLRTHQPATDQDAADALYPTLRLNSINSIRNVLVTAGLVEPAGTIEGPCGTRRTRWRIREGGW